MTDILHATTLLDALAAAGALTFATGVVLAAVLAADLALSRRVSAGMRAALYVAVFARLAFPADWASPLGLRGGDASNIASVTVTDVELAKGVGSLVPSGGGSSRASWAPGLGLALYGGGAAVLVATWLVARRRLSRSLADAIAPRERLRALAGGLPVFEHPSCGPALVGLLRPRIVIPKGLAATLGDDALRAVLAHEAAHLRRRDPMRLALMHLMTFAAWPLIPAWIAAWRVRGLMEQACDEEAVAATGAAGRRAYGEAMLAVAERQPLPARLALGMLAFGGGLAPRLQALRHARRWPRPIQAALVLALPLLALLASGTRGVRADDAGGPAAFPPLVLLDIQGLPGLSEIPAAATVVGSARDGDVERIAMRGPATELREALGLEPHGQGTLRAWLGGSTFTNLRMGDASAQKFVFRWTPRLIEGDLLLTIGWPLPGGDITEVPVPLRQGEAVLLVVRGPGRPAAGALLVPANVSWGPQGALVDSPRVTLDLSDVSVDAALGEIQKSAGVPVAVDGASPPLISLTLDDVPVETALARVAQAAGLLPRMKNGMLGLVGGRVVAQHVDASIRSLAGPDVRVVSLLMDGDVVLVQVEAARDAGAAFVKRLNTEGDVFEVNVTKGDDAASFAEGAQRWLLMYRPAPSAPEQTVQVHSSAWSVDAKELPALLARSGIAASADCADVTEQQLGALSHEMKALETRGLAELITRPVVLARLGQEASIATTGPSGTDELAFTFTATRSTDGLTLDARASLRGTGVASETRCQLVARGVLQLDAGAGRSLLVVVESRPAD